jgi:predicted esterase
MKSKQLMKKIFCIIFILIVSNIFADTVVFLNELATEELFGVLSNNSGYTEPVEMGIVIRDSIVINDSLTAPYAYYIPSGYDVTTSTPLFVYLHGGVSVPDFYPMDDLKTDNDFIDFAEENNMLLLLPMANMQCTWWDETGAQNILNQIILVKKKYNVDDNRVYVSGISDGGSGSFHLAMTRPDVFASFYPFIGMMSVGNLVNGKQTYPANLANRFVAAVNNDGDGLYPAAKIRKTINMAHEAGADLFYKEFWGYGHEVPYLKEYLSSMLLQMQSHPRDPFQPVLYWEVSEMEFNRCDWLEITQIDTLLPKREWHQDYNVKLTDDRMMFGFNNDREYEGEGTLVTRVVENSAAFDAELQENDLIIKMDGKTAANIDTLITWRDAKRRGDEFTLTVLRGDEEIKLIGKFPEPTEYDAFNLTKPSGAVKARYYGNHFEIETSRISQIAIYLHPEMINYDIPVIISINSKEVFNQKLEINREFMRSNFEENQDRKALWTNRIVLIVPKEN